MMRAMAMTLVPIAVRRRFHFRQLFRHDWE
jgi:hypothetical protein